MRKLLFILLALSFSLSSCSIPEAAGAAIVAGKIYIKRHWSNDFSRIYTYQSVKLREPVQSPDSNSYAEFGIAYTSFILLPDSQASVRKVKTTEQGDLWVTMDLEFGSIFVDVSHSIGKGSFEIRTTNGVVTQQSGSMLITQDTSTRVICTTGSASLIGDGSVVLLPNQVSSLSSRKAVPEPVSLLAEPVFSDNPMIQKLIEDRIEKITSDNSEP